MASQETSSKPNQSSYALVDCNSFFCSCERLFYPQLRNKPVGVLSNNDGCFVSLSRELKALKVPMGVPYFKVKDICQKHNVAVFSSNFSLYTNMSDRVMSVLSEFTPELEIYSVDEAFLNLSGFENFHLKNYGQKIKDCVEKNTGIPVSIGIGPTKTLAKIANYMAKKYKSLEGILDLTQKEMQDKVLAYIPVIEIWGVARATEQKLHSLGIYTAKDYRDYKNEKLIKKIFTKVGLQRQDELKGIPQFQLELNTKNKKEIICSRSFGSSVYHLDQLRASVANHTQSATEKLRGQNSVCTQITVYARTSPFKSTSQYYYGHEVKKFLAGTNDTRKVIKMAMKALNQLYKMGYEYKKAGVKLSNITDINQSQLSLFEDPESESSQALMRAMDAINARDGTGTLTPAICKLRTKPWAMNRNHKSPRHVIGWGELKKVN